MQNPHIIPKLSANTPFRKIFEGVASRYQMFQNLNRHSEAPFDEARLSGSTDAGEWFEITETGYDYMLNILPPLFVRGGLFAMSEFLAGTVTSVFLALCIDGKKRWFHGYCDLDDKGSPEALRAAIIERESHPVRSMTRAERLEHIWSSTHGDYRGYAGQRFAPSKRGQRTVLICSGNTAIGLKLLDELNDEDIAAKLPVQLRDLPELIAA
jgi:Protein of unknown function (DUF1419)